MILIVEDSTPTALSLKKQIENWIPEASVSVVGDQENAMKALTGEEYREYDFDSKSVQPAPPATFVAVIWDNNFPKSENGVGCINAGLETIEALKCSQKVNQTVLSHFVFHSSDESLPLLHSKHFIAVYHKPMLKNEFEDLRLKYREWIKGDIESSCSQGEQEEQDFQKQPIDFEEEKEVLEQHLRQFSLSREEVVMNPDEQ